jgi:hypothetical protein
MDGCYVSWRRYGYTFGGVYPRTKCLVVPVFDEALKAVIYDTLHSLGRIEGDISAIREAVEEFKDKHEVLDASVEKLQNNQYWFMGGGAALVFVLSLAVHWVIK